MMSAALLDLSTGRAIDIYATVKYITDWINKHEREYSGASCSNDQHKPRSYKFAAVGDLPRLSGRVLVAEDDWASRKLAEVFLIKLGLTPVFAEDGQQLLEAVIKGDPADLILMDVRMPVLDGYSATQRIRQFEIENGEAKRSIIALTAAAYEEDRQRCLDVGMDDVLTKPLDLTDLIAVLARWLPREPADLIAKPPEQRPVDTATVGDYTARDYCESFLWPPGPAWTCKCRL